MKSLRRIALLTLGLGALASCSIIPDARAALRYQPLEAEGTFGASGGGISSNSSFDQLGLGDNEDTISPRGDISWGPFDLMVSAFQLDASGNGQVSGEIDLGGVTIPAGENVASELDLTQAVALLTWDLVPTDLVDVGLGVGVTYLDLDFALTGEISGTSRTAEEVPVPVLAARAEVEFGPLTANVHLHGIALDLDGVDAMYLDADAFLAYRLKELLGFEAQVQLGYRHIEVEFEYDDDGSQVDADLELSGLYLGLAVGF